MGSDYSHLDEIPIEELGLSEAAINALKHRGMTTVGDCIYYYRLIPNVIMRPLRSDVNSELKEALKAQGYWSYVEDDE